MHTCFPSYRQPPILCCLSCRPCCHPMSYHTMSCREPQVAVGAVAAGADGEADDGSNAAQRQAGEGAQGVPCQGRPTSPSPVRASVFRFQCVLSIKHVCTAVHNIVLFLRSFPLLRGFSGCARYPLCGDACPVLSCPVCLFRGRSSRVLWLSSTVVGIYPATTSR